MQSYQKIGTEIVVSECRILEREKAQMREVTVPRGVQNEADVAA